MSSTDAKTLEGRPCPLGHTLRYVKDRKCVACKKLHAKKWREANPERHKGNARAWNNFNPSAVWLIRIRKRAKELGLEFSLSAEDLKIPATCPLLGIPLLRGGEQNAPNTPSLDRIDPQKGYVKGNVRVVSFLANSMKRNATKEQLLLFASNLPAYLETQ